MKFGIEMKTGGVNGTPVTTEIHQSLNDELRRRGLGRVGDGWSLSIGVNDYGCGAVKVGCPIEVVPGQPSVVLDGMGQIAFADGVMVRVVEIKGN